MNHLPQVRKEQVHSPLREFIQRNFSPAAGVLVQIDRRRFLQTMAVLAAIFAYATIVLGGTVRGMGAGLACPDWPLCYGSLVPNVANPRILVEYAHRLVALLTGLFVLCTLLAAILWFRSEVRLVTLSFMSFAVLATQVVAGALTITTENDPAIVTLHLALGTATLAAALIVAMMSLWPPSGRENASPSP